MRVHTRKIRDIGNIASKIVRADFSADYVPFRKQLMDFSNTENPLGHAARVENTIMENFSLISHYPERGHDTLIAALSKHHRLPADCFFAGNGATGCIQNVVMAFVSSGHHVLLPELSFPLPLFAATVMGGGGLMVAMRSDFGIDFDALLRSINRQTRLVFLCNPNNPTGLFEKPETILTFARKTNVPVLVSEASVEYAGKSLMEFFTAWPDNLIVVRSFSKVHGLAALRVGYGVAAPKLVSEIIKTQLPFAVSRLSQAAAIAALKDKEHMRRSVAFMREERQFLSEGLSALGFSVLSPQANMLLAELPGHASDTRQFAAAMEKQGITVLEGKAFSSALKRHVRISPRTRKLNVAFLAAARKAL